MLMSVHQIEQLAKTRYAGLLRKAAKNGSSASRDVQDAARRLRGTDVIPAAATQAVTR